MQTRKWWLLAAIAWCAAIFFVTGAPTSTGSSTQQLLERYLEISPETAAGINFAFRKLVHLGAFAVLAVLFCNGLKKRRFLFAWLLTTLYAATDEFHQSFLPDRTASVWDVALDSLGALLGVGLVVLFSTMRRQKRRMDR